MKYLFSAFVIIFLSCGTQKNNSARTTPLDSAENLKLKMAIHDYFNWPHRNADYEIPYPHPWRANDTSWAMVWNDTLVVTHDEKINIYGWGFIVTKCINPITKQWFNDSVAVTIFINKEPYGKNESVLKIERNGKVKLYRLPNVDFKACTLQ